MTSNFENTFKEYLLNILSKYDDYIINYFNFILKCSNILIKKINNLYILIVNKI